MPTLPPPESTRLVTIIAHVDHGKTTLADNLIESNGIISERLAGTLRYLDSDPEEQRRGITMRASAIGLKHSYIPPKISQNKHQSANTSNGGSSSPSSRDMVIHLVDSPGHVDFAAEVTSSLLLCDSAILVVDAVEGLCPRTHSLVREAYLHQLVPILVINKVDRLCNEMGLDSTESYVRIRELIESMNAVCAAMLNSAATDDVRGFENSIARDAEIEVWNFDPIKGNVVFASALHGWGFTVPTLARSLFKSKSVPMKPPLMRQYLFGDYKYNSETGKVLKWKQSGGGGGEPMFAEYALQPIWEIYEGVSQAATSVGLKSEFFVDTGVAQHKKKEHAKIEATTQGMERVITALHAGSTSSSFISPQPGSDSLLPKTAQDLQRILSRLGAGSESSIVCAVLRRYRPLSDAILDAVCEIGPSPVDAALRYRTRALALQTPGLGAPAVAMKKFTEIQDAVRQCSHSESDAPTVAHVCKFTSTTRASVADPDLPPPQSSSEHIILGIARVLCGSLRTGDVEYYMFGPRYDGHANNITKRKIRCYLLMGSSFVRVDFVPAGHICAIYNLEDLQLKTVTLCNRIDCMPLHGFDLGLQPLVKVNVEPVSASDIEMLERGLLKLSLADSSVEVMATAKGERILACLGEIHLEQSILDLQTVYCDNIKLRISDPITSFCETTDWFENEWDFDSFLDDKSPQLRQTNIPPYCDEEGLGFASKGRCRTILSGRGAAISVRAVPLPRSVYDCLSHRQLIDGSNDDLIALGKALGVTSDENSLTAHVVFKALLDCLDETDGNGNALLESSALSAGNSVKGVLSANGEVYLPPTESSKNREETNNNVSPTDGVDEYEATRQHLREGLACTSFPPRSSASTNDDADGTALQKWRQDLRGSALGGFQLAMRSGPLCEEPVRGVAVILESVEIAVTSCLNGPDRYQVARDLTGGMVVAALRSGIRCALLTRPARLVEGHLRLTLHSSLAGLGALHSVLSRRRGKVVTDAMVEGTDLIQVTATIPQAESFGLPSELMKKSSGEVTAPELVFSHWEVLNEDPFWIPTTEEEREDYGQNLQTGDSSTGLDNTALKYIRMVRSRKGLLVDSSKIVVAAEKQRTLSKKK